MTQLKVILKIFAFTFLKKIFPFCSDNASLRLVGGRSESEGRVEILHAGRWGTFCANQFDNREAQVSKQTPCNHPHSYQIN